MYERKENEKEGSYYPAFLCMEVNTPDDLYYLGRYPLDERTEAVFLHEYIHYLQDLTTVAGLARIETIVDQIKWVCGEADKHKKIRIPIDTDTWAYNIMPNAHSLSICKGNFRVHDEQNNVVEAEIVTIISFNLVETVILYTSGQTYKGRSVARLTFRDQYGYERNYDIGEMAISESMAYLIENHVYPNVLRKPSDCPYFIVKKIAEWKLQRSVDDFSLIALCDVCLLYTLPGKVLYDVLEKLEHCEASISPALIYLYGLGADMSDEFNRKNNWIGELSMVTSIAKKQFSDMFIHPYWENFKNVTNSAFDAALTLRMDNPVFFLDIVRGGRLNLNKQLQTCINSLGCLSIKTAANAVYNFAPNVATNVNLDSDWFLSLYQFYNILFTNSAIRRDGEGHKYLEKECDLKQWCRDSFVKKGERNLTTESPNCSWAPWLNVGEDDLRLCSFGRIWDVFGFARTKIKAKN